MRNNNSACWLKFQQSGGPVSVSVSSFKSTTVGKNENAKQSCTCFFFSFYCFVASSSGRFGSVSEAYSRCIKVFTRGLKTEKKIRATKYSEKKKLVHFPKPANAFEWVSWCVATDMAVCHEGVGLLPGTVT